MGEQKCGGYYVSGIASGITVGTMTSIVCGKIRRRGSKKTILCCAMLHVNQRAAAWRSSNQVLYASLFVRIAGREKVDKESFVVLCSLCKPFVVRYKTRGEKQVERLGKAMCLLS